MGFQSQSELDFTAKMYFCSMSHKVEMPLDGAYLALY